MAVREDGSYPRMDKLLHEAPTRDAKGDNALPLGELLFALRWFSATRTMRGLPYNYHMLLRVSPAAVSRRCIRALVWCR